VELGLGYDDDKLAAIEGAEFRGLQCHGAAEEDRQGQQRLERDMWLGLRRAAGF
jgi:hypothetical protein